MSVDDRCLNDGARIEERHVGVGCTGADSLTMAGYLLGWRASSHVSVETLSMRTPALIGNAIVEALDVRLTVGLRSIQIISVRVTHARWYEIAQALADIVVRQIVT